MSKILGLQKKAFLLVVLFTVVEIIALTVWIVLFGLPLKNQLVSGIVLSVGLFIEHYISVFAGGANDVEPVTTPIIEAKK